MNKFLFGILGAIALSGCTEDALMQQSSDNDVIYGMPVFTASSEQHSRAQLADDLSVIWQADDQISIFNRSTDPLLYQLDGEGGSTRGTFKSLTSATTTPVLNFYGAIYPYQEHNAAAATEGGLALTYSLPATQTYTPGSFDKSAFPMLAVSATQDLAFKNAAGVLKLQLTGTEVVKSITLTGNNGEDLNGQYTTSLTSGGTWGETTATQTGQMVTLDCGTTGVQLNAATATTFHILLPPTEFSKGFTVKVQAEGTVATLTTEKVQTIRRNEILKMPAVACQFKASAPSKLIYGNIFTNLIPANATQLTFVPHYTSPVANGTLVSIDGTTPAYIIPDETTAEDKNDYLVVTAADEFLFHENSSQMFSLKGSLKKIVLNGCNTSAVTDMSYMFDSCNSLTELDLGDKFDTSKVKVMTNMFRNSRYLETLNLGTKFYVDLADDVSGMFSNLGVKTKNGTDLILSEVTDFKNCKYVGAMFGFATLRSVKCSDDTKGWIESNAKDNGWNAVTLVNGFQWNIY